MKWKIPLTTIIDGTAYELAVDSIVFNRHWVIVVDDSQAKQKILPEPLRIHFSLDKKMISYEPINMVNRKVAPYIAEDLLKHQREHSAASQFGSPVQSEPFTSL